MVDTIVVEAVAALLRDHDRVLVFTGAGISTSSGIPDFRGPQGVWKTRRPIYYQEFMGSAEARAAYWQQKLEDSRAHGGAIPNPVHHAIVELERAGKVDMVVTQNIDGLHRAAGTAPTRLVEVHGTTSLVECQTCGERTDPGLHYERFAATGEPPVCGCGGYLKTATISFGQNLRAEDLLSAFAAADRCDMVLALGSTLSVTPAADIPLRAARRGVPYVVVNRGQTDHDHLGVITLRVEGDVGDVIPPAVALVIGSGGDDR